MEVVIRALTPEDPIPYELLLLATPPRPLVEEYLARGFCYLAGYGPQVVGVLVLIRTRPETMEIVNLAVAEPCQGKGVGKKLIGHAVARARDMQIRTLEIGTGSTGVGQLLLYQKCGFRITGVDRDFFVRHYPEPLYENGMQLRDMVRLGMACKR
jgi:ribosomal protein S18 acetylase RimI-like enzyme